MRLCASCGATLDGTSWQCRRCGFAPAEKNGFCAFAPDLSGSAADFDHRHYAVLEQHEAGHFWFAARRELICKLLMRHFPNARSMLEIGCGTGHVLAAIAAAFPSLQLSASEVQIAGLKAAKRRAPAASFYQLDARKLPFREEFDVIGCFDVVEHIDEDEIALAQMFQALRPNGGVLLSVPQHAWLWSKVDEAAGHKRRYGAAELRGKIRRAGFVIEQSTSFVMSPLPLMLWSRFAGRRKVEGAELEVPTAANMVLRQVLRVEATIIAAGIPLPFGGSRFIVARRPGRSG